MGAARVVVDAAAFERMLTRIAHEIVERTDGGRDVTLLGIPRRGVPLAERIAEHMGRIRGYVVPWGSLDVTMFRDDLRMRPARALMPTAIPDSGVDGRTVILVDDVLYTARTIRAALDALQEIGRPALVQLAVLIDRGHRELPIRADYVGKNIPTSRRESVEVHVLPHDDEDGVLLLGGEDA